jgi:hypothetical protein
MATKIIEAYECKCDKCEYVWTSINIPVTCANKKCRSWKWNSASIKSVAVTTLIEKTPEVEKKIELPSEDKKETISDLQKMINSIKEKSSDKTKSVIADWPTKPPVDQPDYYDNEHSVRYD